MIRSRSRSSSRKSIRSRIPHRLRILSQPRSLLLVHSLIRHQPHRQYSRHRIHSLLLTGAGAFTEVWFGIHRRNSHWPGNCRWNLDPCGWCNCTNPASSTLMHGRDADGQTAMPWGRLHAKPTPSPSATYRTHRHTTARIKPMTGR